MGNKGAAGVNTRLIKQCLTYTCSIYSYSPVFHLASLSIVAFEVLNFQKNFEDHSQGFLWLIVTHFPSQIRICSETGMFLNSYILWGIFFFPSHKGLCWQNFSSHSSGAGPSEVMPC